MLPSTRRAHGADSRQSLRAALRSVHLQERGELGGRPGPSRELRDEAARADRHGRMASRPSADRDRGSTRIDGRRRREIDEHECRSRRDFSGCMRTEHDRTRCRAAPFGVTSPRLIRGDEA